MKMFRLATGFTIAVALCLSGPAFAKTKTKAKVKSRPIAGISCSQGPESIFIGASSLKPGVRARLRVGQKARVNIAGFGPIDCFVR
jgi:hypothetical protein